MRVLQQQDHCDLGLVDNDNTEDMRRAATAALHHAVADETGSEVVGQ